MFEILAWIVFGGLIGWIASLIVEKNILQRPIPDVIAGAAGAVLGGILFRVYADNPQGFSSTRVLVAGAGAIVSIAIVKFVRDR